MKLIFLILAAGAAFAQTTLYPGALDNDTSLFVVSDNVQTTLSAAMAVGDTAAVVGSAAGFVPNMIATICDTTTNTGKCTAWEHMLVTAINGNILTVTRAFAGTTARAHTAGRLVSVLIDSAHQKVLKDSVVAIETALGPNLSNIAAGGLVTAASFNFSPYSCNPSPVCSPGGASGFNLITGNNSLTMTPVPNGVNGTDTGHALYISGGSGTAEACTITGGSGLSGQASGQIIVNCAGSHSGAWTLASASGGLQEAICSLPPAGGQVTVVHSLTLYANVTACGKASVIVVRQPGAILTGSFLILGAPPNSPNSQTEMFINSPQYDSTLTQVIHGTRVVMGNFPVTSEFGSNTVGGVNVIIGLLDIPSTATTGGGSAVAGYARTNSSAANATGIYGEGDAAASSSGISAWGANTRTQNCTGENECSGNVGTTGVNLYGYESDMNVIPTSTGGSPSGNVFGIYIIGGSRAQTTGTVHAIDINPMGVWANIGWKDGIYLEDGAATNSGISIGATGSGNNVSSMPLNFYSRSAGGSYNGAQIFADAIGDLQIKSGSSTGTVVLADTNLNAGLILSPNGSAPQVQIVNGPFMRPGAPIAYGTSAFASLGAVPAAGTSVYCTNCTTAPTCAAGGSGHLAISNGTAWACN